DPRMAVRLLFLEAELLEDAVHALRTENAHEVVLERQEEMRMAGVALPAGAAAKLVIDAPALVALGAYHVEATGGERFLFQLGHLGADRGDALVALFALGQSGKFL